MSSVSAPDVSRSIRRHLIVGCIASVVMVSGIGGWAAATSLSGAVIAPGTFVVDTYVKKIQHPTGGVVGEILVGEGDKVEAGDVLLRLDATQTKAKLAIVNKRLIELTTRLARLEAERDDSEEIAFPEWLLTGDDDADTASALKSEKRLFDFRKASRNGKKAQLYERIEQYEHEIDGLKAQEVAYDRGLAALDREITSLRSLFEKGIVNTQRLNSLEAQAATFGGERGEKIAFRRSPPVAFRKPGCKYCRSIRILKQRSATNCVRFKVRSANSSSVRLLPRIS